MTPDRTAGLTRRDFIIATTAAAGAALGTRAAAAPRYTTRAHGILGANERITFAIAGSGGIGRAHLLAVLTELSHTQNVALVAVADPSPDDREWARQCAGLERAAAFADAFEMIQATKDLDVVVVAMPDRRGVRLTTAALESGRHVYVEPPVTERLGGLLRIQDAARTSRRIVQVGSLPCSDPKWRRAREIVEAGTLGALSWAQQGRHRAVGDPDAWWDELYPFVFAMNVREAPSRVTCIEGGRSGRMATAASPVKTRGPGGTATVVIEFPTAAPIFLAGAPAPSRGVRHVIRGQQASLVAGPGNLLLQPAHRAGHDVWSAPAQAGSRHAAHMRNFIECVRTDAAPSCPIELAVLVHTIVSMAAASQRQNMSVGVDEIFRQLA